jgi:hypothetical protein
MEKDNKQLVKLLTKAEKNLKRTAFKDLDIHLNENGEVHSVTFVWEDKKTYYNYRFHHSKDDFNQESLFFDILDADGRTSFYGCEVSLDYASFLKRVREYFQKKIIEEAEREKVSFEYLSRRIRKLARFYEK